MLHEAFGRDELHLAGSNVLVGDETAYAAVMIEMRMAVDRRDDRSFTELLGQEGIGRLGRLGGTADIICYPSAVSANEGEVCQIVASDLVDAIGDLEQTVLKI